MVSKTICPSKTATSTRRPRSPSQYVSERRGRLLRSIQIRLGDTSAKRWIALFTCSVTRAVHLEVAEKLSASSFLDCLRRFVARRGVSQYIISDNETNFRLTSAMFEQLQKRFANKDIECHFIAQFSPCSGIIYERMVGLTKDTFRKAIRKNYLDVN